MEGDNSDILSYNCDGDMTIEEATECMDSENHVFVNQTLLNEHCYCACRDNDSCPNGMIRELPDCECKCDPELEQQCESYQVLVKTQSGKSCECACDENKKSQCNLQTHIWNEATCECICPPGDCPAKFAKNENCECVCDPDHNDHQCSGGQILQYSDQHGCHCACESGLESTCIGHPSLEFHQDIENRFGLLFLFENTSCNCSVRNKENFDDVWVESLYPADVLSCVNQTGGNYDFNFHSGNCECSPSLVCNEDFLKVNESNCECDCLDNHVETCNKFSGTLEKVYALGELEHCQCVGYNGTKLSAIGNSGDKMVIVRDGNPFYYTGGQLQNADQDIIATSAVLSPFTENEEEHEIESVATSEDSGDVEITFKQQLENTHEIEAEIVPIFSDSPTPSSSTTFSQATQTETPCVGAGCDPHISTFFNEKFEM